MPCGKMKIHGNYYKNTVNGKRRADFALEISLNTSNLTELRREAEKILKAQDKEFRGIRELFIDDKIELPMENKIDGVEEQEIRQLAREKGLKNVGNKKIERLLQELKELEQK